jgi:polysaccharide export outer membrane protein
LAGIKYSVIGEGRNGQFYLYQNEANIFEALGNAGGVDFLGNRYAVQIVRMHPEGVKYYEIDLTDKRVVSDPRYFIQPNDIINIRPLRQRSWGIGETGFQTFLALLSAVSSSLALIVAIQTFSKD